jgi:hypothetical protein
VNCTAHPAQPIVGSCHRCGNFVCALDSRSVKDELHCLDCAGRVADHLRALRDELWGLNAAIVGLLIPGVSLIGLACCLMGLSRVDPKATPPIGRRGMAIAGTILSVIGIAGWTTLIAVSALH